MVTALMARLRSLFAGVRGGSRLDEEMKEEFRTHLQMRTDDLVRAGLSPREAARQARLEFGSPDHFVDRGRESRGLRIFDGVRFSMLDFKLGARMLARYPGLTLVGGLAMAFAIWMGASVFELGKQVIDPRLPLADGDRVIGVELWDQQRNGPERRAAWDFIQWRSGLRSVQGLGAFRAVRRNLVVADGSAEPVTIAEVSASAGPVTRVRPAMGRFLLPEDERQGAAAVVVLGHDIWTNRFGADPAIIGKGVRLGQTMHTIVGVMPPEFAFPVSHGIWTPLRLDASAVLPREGPGLQFFGRLAPGATIERAQAELDAVVRRAAVSNPDTHGSLVVRVKPYARSIFDFSGLQAAAVLSVNVPLLLLLALICANVALLMFARAVSRRTEIVVRAALGASRSRIVMQLFAEALVLGVVSAAVGLALAEQGMRWTMWFVASSMEGIGLPFWIQPSLSLATVGYAAALTLFAALIAGVLPGLRVTRGIGTQLRAGTAGGGAVRIGGIWTAVIVAQVAVTVAFPAITFMLRAESKRIRNVDIGIAAERILTARLEMDEDASNGAPVDTSRAEFLARYAAALRDLERRLESDGGGTVATFGDRLPLMYHPHRIVVIDSGGAAPLHPNYPNGYRVSSATVAPDFFQVMGAPVLHGRALTPADSGAPRIVVNESFVRLVLGGRNAIGRRVRYVDFEEWEAPRPDAVAREPWHEIVGVVQDLGFSTDVRVGADPKIAGFYHPMGAAPVYPAHVAVRVASGSARSFIPRLRATVVAADPSLRLYAPRQMDELLLGDVEFMQFWFRLLLAVSVVALSLSLAGIYAVTSFTVAQRTREIGVRVALGATPRRIVLETFARPLRQVGLGIVVGALFVALFMSAVEAGEMSPMDAALVAGYGLVMFAVCMLACVVPTRRVLAVQPTEALRAEG